MTKFTFHTTIRTDGCLRLVETSIHARNLACAIDGLNSHMGRCYVMTDFTLEADGTYGEKE